MKDTNPVEIENKSFAIIKQQLGDKKIPIENERVLLRVIHTTADFDYVNNLRFKPNVVAHLKQGLKNGVSIVTDTTMCMAGINKKVLDKHGGKVYCFVHDEDVAAEAAARGVTRSIVAMEKASKLKGNCIFALGNAPTALITIVDMFKEGIINPFGVIGVPVGFVNVVESKELLWQTNIPAIVAMGRKGGSNVAAAICNGLLYG